MTTIKPSPVAFLPIITKSRELEARALLAAYLLEGGYRVVIGRSGDVHRAAGSARDGLYFSPLLVLAAASRLKKLKERGHKIIAWDEEGLVYPDPAWYFSNRVSAESARHADAVLAWGAIPARDLAATLPPEIGPIRPLGNARIDLLRAPHRSIYEAEAERLRGRFGRYVLVNTNFDLVNHADGPEGLQRRLRKGGRIAGEQDERKFAEWAVFRQAAFDAFTDGLPQLHDAFPGLTFVLRPHPSENLEPWRALAARYPRIELQPPAGPVYSWILGAEAVLHNSCTTAVEAFMFDVPVIAFHPAVPAGAMDSPLPNELSRPAHSWGEVIELLRRLLRDGSRGWVSEEQVRIADAFIGARTGAFSSQEIVRLAHELGASAMATRFDTPLAAARVWQGLREWAKRLLGRPGLGPDDRARFSGLARSELAATLEKFSAVTKRPVRIRTMGRDLFMLELAK